MIRSAEIQTKARDARVRDQQIEKDLIHLSNTIGITNLMDTVCVALYFTRVHAKPFGKYLGAGSIGYR